MSELKARGVDDVYVEYYNTGKHELAQVYLRIDVDNHIDNLKDKVISMIRDPQYCRGLDLQSTIGQIANVMFKHWNEVERTRSNNAQLRKDKANLLRNNESLRNELKSQKLERINDKYTFSSTIRRHAQKRCKTMVDYLNSEWGCELGRPLDMRCHSSSFSFSKWIKIWTALAENPMWDYFLQLIHKDA